MTTTITIDRATVEQALEALWYYHATEFGRDTPAGKAIAAFHAALEQQAEPVEPVAWVRALPDGRLDRLSVVAYEDEAEEMLQRSIAGCTLVPLYTAPPQRKPLTEEEIQELSQQHKFDSRMEKFVRIIERAHGIGGSDE